MTGEFDEISLSKDEDLNDSSDDSDKIPKVQMPVVHNTYGIV